jgi:hypothetical protein
MNFNPVAENFVVPPALHGGKRSFSVDTLSTLCIGQRQYPKDRVQAIFELLRSSNTLLRQENSRQARQLDGLVRQQAALLMQNSHLIKEIDDLRKQIEASRALK